MNSMTQDMIKTIRTIKTTWTSPTSALRAMLLLLVMMVGAGETWGQLNGAGTYYIKNNSTEYYLVPTINCSYTNDEDKPHLTTFKTGGDKNSIWRIEEVIDGNKTYYRIIHNATGKYLLINDPVPELSTADAHRKRIHLETVSVLSNLNNSSLFEIGINSGSNYYISPGYSDWYSSTTGNDPNGSFKFFNPRGGNKDRYRADDGTGITNTNGIIGFWSSKGGDSNWNFVSATQTCANPVIQYDDAGTNIQISYPISDDTGWTIYYTTDGSDPGDDTNANRTPITSTATISATSVSKVRAIATKTDWDSSDEAVLIASGVTQMVQSKECDAFYMVPPIVDGDLTCATTTNIPNAKMGWNFVSAGLYCGIQYYNIINAETSEYLFCSGNNGNDNALTMVSSSDISTSEQIDRAKFRLIVQADGSYKVISKWWTAENPNAYYVNKKNGNNGGNAINLAAGTDNNSLWNVIAVPSSPKTQFDASFASSSSSVHFYEIQSATDNTYHVLPPTTSTGKATANTTGANPAWFFMPVEDNDTWIPYYHIRNGATGEYLYYNSGFYTSTTVESGNEDSYMFIVVKSAYTTTTNPIHYNIIPKSLKDNANQTSNSLNRNNTTLRTQDSRNKPESNWKLEEVALFCNNPVFTETESAISISCVPDITRIYYTTDGTDPNPNDETQRYTNTTSLSASDKLCIKAISFVSNETTSASSDVFTLLNKPDVTLETGPYIYKAAAWEPAVTLSIDDVQTTTGFSTTYNNNINVGTEANVTITDNNAADALYIWNVPVTYFTIDKKTLEITAKNKSIGYGDEPDNDGVTYDGFVVPETEETEGVFGGTLEYSYTTSGDDPHPYTPYDPQYGNQGNYVITPGGLTSTNYDITFISGTMTVTKKSIGDGSLAPGFTLSFDESGEVILKYGTHALIKDVDYTIGDEVSGTKYSSKTISGTGNSGTGNYTGYLSIRNAIVHFTSDDNQIEWSATFVAESSGENDIGHALPDGISAYIISGIDGTWAIPEPLDYIPAGVPVLLVAHEEKNGFLVSDANSESVNEITNLQKGYNLLKEVTEESAHFNTKQIYVLYKNEFVLNKEGDLGRGKVYMENPNYNTSSPFPAPARLTIIWGNETNIEDIQTNGAMEVGNERWYTIDGRRLNGKPNAKGLYILNGKKKVVK